MKKRFLIVIAILLGSILHAQNLEGLLFDSLTKESIANANIFNKTNGVSTIADIKGGFSIQAKVGDILEISSLGFTLKKYTVNSLARVNIALQSGNSLLDEVVVTANRSIERKTDAPVSIGKVSPKMIAETKPRDIFELLNKVSGVNMANFNNEQHGMSIRQPMASLSPYFLYLEEGLPIRAMGVFNHNALLEMNVPAINSIEVLKGPASSIYGPEAIGGSVNFLMQKPTAVTTVKAGIQADNYDYYRFHVAASGAINKRLGYAVTVSKTGQNNGWMLYSDYNKEGYSARLDYKLSNKTVLWATYNQVDYFSQMSGSVDSIAFYSRRYVSTTDFTYRQVFTRRTRLTLEHKWNERNNTTLTFFVRNSTTNLNPTFTIRWVSGRDSALNEVNSNKFTSTGIVAQHNLSLPFWKAKVIAGFSFDNSPNRYFANLQVLDAQLRPGGLSVERFTVRRFDPNAFTVNYDARIFNLGSWLQTEFTPINKLKVVAGFRYDRLAFDYTSLPTLTQSTTASGNKSSDQISPRIAFSYALQRNMGLFVNYARGFVQANLSTLFNPANPQGLNLQPARFDSYEIGGWASLIKNKLYADITFYQNTGRNEVVNVRQPDNSTIPTSSGQTLHRGVEYGINYKHSSELDFRVSATNALHRFDVFILSVRPADQLKNVDGKVMPSSPNFMGNTEITYRPKQIKGFRISAEWQYMSSWYQNQINTIKYDDAGFLGAKGISLLNLRTGFTIKSIEFFLNVYNATNELYANSVTRGNAVTDRATFNAGAPRQFNFGFQYSFVGKK